MMIAAAARGAHVASWQEAALAELRALPGVAVRSVDSAAADGAAYGNADLVLDLDGSVGGPAATEVWSFRLGAGDDPGLPFARELMAGADVLEAALLVRSGGETRTIRVGRFAARGSYAATLRSVRAELARWPALFVAARLAGIETPSEPDAPPPPKPILHGLRRTLFPALMFVRSLRLLARGLVVVDCWNVGFASGDARDVLAGRPLAVRWLRDPAPQTFVADPFLVERDGVRALFVEQFDYRRDRGIIEAYVLDGDDRIARTVPVLDFATHLSYPYPLEIDGELYLMPENSAAGEVALYRCAHFPDRWEREQVPFPHFDGVDMTVFPHAGRWWAMGTSLARGSTTALFAFHADSPRGPWTAHALNPIVVDVGRGRPAGPPFVVDGTLYRCGQDCAHTYGGAIVISRVDALTPTAYRETEVRRLEPDPSWRFPDGVHTLSFARDRTIVLDGKRTYYDLRYISRLGRILRDRLSRGRLQGRALDPLQER